MEIAHLLAALNTFSSASHCGGRARTVSKAKKQLLI
jgi:hypothetical protein